MIRFNLGLIMRQDVHTGGEVQTGMMKWCREIQTSKIEKWREVLTGKMEKYREVQTGGEVERYQLVRCRDEEW